MSHPAKTPRLGRTLLAAPAAIVLLLVLHQILPRFGDAHWCVLVTPLRLGKGTSRRYISCCQHRTSSAVLRLVVVAGSTPPSLPLRSYYISMATPPVRHRAL